MAKAKKQTGKKLKDLKGKGKTVARREAEAVQGGRKAGGAQQEYLVYKMNDVIISG
jgi:type VI protein secretion system component Hcp